MEALGLVGADALRGKILIDVSNPLQESVFVVISIEMSNRGCSHLDALTSVKTAERLECAECVKVGASWVHLRTCQECGVTLCCDSSPNRHATKHARATGHPVIASAQPGERWLYCYPDDTFAEY